MLHCDTSIMYFSPLFSDFAVGAPYKDNGQVYIYSGSATGVLSVDNPQVYKDIPFTIFCVRIISMTKIVHLKNIYSISLSITNSKTRRCSNSPFTL